jgi:hypothetical protein
MDICLEAIYHGYKVMIINCSVDHLGGQTSVRPDYVNWLKKYNRTDAELHRNNHEIFYNKWMNRCSVFVDDNFNYRNQQGQIEMK